jgi:hypothetical protein
LAVATTLVLALDLKDVLLEEADDAVVAREVEIFGPDTACVRRALVFGWPQRPLECLASPYPWRILLAYHFDTPIDDRIRGDLRQNSPKSCAWKENQSFHPEPTDSLNMATTEMIASHK